MLYFFLVLLIFFHLSGRLALLEDFKYSNQCQFSFSLLGVRPGMSQTGHQEMEKRVSTYPWKKWVRKTEYSFISWISIPCSSPCLEKGRFISQNHTALERLSIVSSKFDLHKEKSLEGDPFIPPYSTVSALEMDKKFNVGENKELGVYGNLRGGHKRSEFGTSNQEDTNSCFYYSSDSFDVLVLKYRLTKPYLLLVNIYDNQWEKWSFKCNV